MLPGWLVDAGSLAGNESRIASSINHSSWRARVDRRASVRMSFCCAADLVIAVFVRKVLRNARRRAHPSPMMLQAAGTSAFVGVAESPAVVHSLSRIGRCRRRLRGRIEVVRTRSITT